MGKRNQKLRRDSRSDNKDEPILARVGPAQNLTIKTRNLRQTSTTETPTIRIASVSKSYVQQHTSHSNSDECPEANLDRGIQGCGGSKHYHNCPHRPCAKSQAKKSRGPRGPRGPRGCKGPKGPQGPDGPEGPQGMKGPEGPQGMKGPEGPEGPEGPRGSTGMKGPTGVGITGPQGPPGSGGTGSDECKKLPFDTIGGTGVKIGDIVTFGSNKDGDNAVHKLLCEKWEWNARIDGPSNNQGPRVVADDSGNAYVTGYMTATPTFYNSDGSLGPTGLTGLGPDQFIVVAKIDAAGCWQLENVVDSLDDDKLPELAIGSNQDLYFVAQGAGDGSPAIYYGPDGSIGLIGPTSSQPQVLIANLNSLGLWEWRAAIQELGLNLLSPQISASDCGSILVATEAGTGATGVFLDRDDNPISLPANQFTRQVAVGQYDRDGHLKWIARVSGTAAQFSPAVQATNQNCSYVAGLGASGPPGFYNRNGQALQLVGQSEVKTQLWTAKIECDGDLIFQSRVTNANSVQRPITATDIYNNLYLGFRSGTTGAPGGPGGPDFYDAGGDLILDTNSS